MVVSWTLTESAVWDWSYSSSTGNGSIFGHNTVYGNTSTASTIFISDTGAGTYRTTLTDAASVTGTYYTSSIVTTETTIKTTTESFEESEGITSTIRSASWDSGASSIATFASNVSATITASIFTESSVLSTVSSGTYLKPLGLPVWVDAAGVADDYLYAPTAYAWTSAAAFLQPAATNATSVATGVPIANSGQFTVYPVSDIFTIPSATNYDPTGVDETWQSATLTWTRQTQSNATLTGDVLSGAPVTRSTEEYQSLVASTRTSSSVFARTFAYNDAGFGETSSWSSWWSSTTLTDATFLVQNQTVAGSTTSTVPVSSAAKVYVNLLDENQSGQQPLAPFQFSESGLHGSLVFGGYSHIFTGHSGYVLNSSQDGAAALSDAGQSFLLPAQSFSTASIQRGVSAPFPLQTRSSTAASATTKWSLGASAVTMTTQTSNSSTSGSTSSSYALGTAGPTVWSTSSRQINQSNTFTAAGGSYPSDSLFVGGGLFSATQGTSEFTGTAVTAGTEVTAFSPLPYLTPATGPQSLQTVNTAQALTGVGFGLPRLAAPLTA